MRPFRPILAILAAIGVVISGPAGAQPLTIEDYEGNWTGTLAVGPQELPLNLHVVPGEEPPVTLDSPAQGAFGLPASMVEVRDNALIVEFGPIGARYEGTISDERTLIDGTFSQGGLSLDLDFGRAEEGELSEAPARPQEPARPLPYAEEDVRIVEPGSGVTLAGTFTRPRGDGPFPGVVLITGSGPQDRDESLLGHRPFFVLADRLTRSGLAVLRYDDRGIGESNGVFAASTTRDFAADATAALRFLSAQPGVSRTGMLGHSEGALAAALAVAEGGAAPAFVVALAGPFVPMEDLLVRQGADLRALAEVSDAEKSADEALQRSILDAAIAAPTPEAACARADEVLADVPSAQAQQSRQFLCSAWGYELLRLEPTGLWGAYDGPLLALFGSKDLQVAAAPNAAAARTLPNAEVRVVDGANHLFQTAETGSIGEYAAIEETMREDVMALIAQWIFEQQPR